ncbi:hypothetical protein R1flu_007286 [Riccia fluitans]|uniref:CTP synthase N-terminal domain-containing protein n=1 Tax=Riccia fluitans TaxID=41844 RepID=A0ABD1YYF2_9MARC
MWKVPKEAQIESTAKEYWYHTPTSGATMASIKSRAVSVPWQGCGKGWKRNPTLSGEENCSRKPWERCDKGWKRNPGFSGEENWSRNPWERCDKRWKRNPGFSGEENWSRNPWERCAKGWKRNLGFSGEENWSNQKPWQRYGKGWKRNPSSSGEESWSKKLKLENESSSKGWKMNPALSGEKHRCRKLKLENESSSKGWKMNPALSGEKHRCRKLKLENESSGKGWKMNPALSGEEHRSKKLKLENQSGSKSWKMNPALIGEEHRSKKLKLENQSGGKGWKINPALNGEEHRCKKLKLENESSGKSWKMNPALSGEEHRSKNLKLENESSGKDWKMNPALTPETPSKENRSKELKLEMVAKFSSELSEEMVETIISMLPYLEILNARTILTYDVERRCWGKLPSPLRLTFRPDGVDCKLMVCKNQLVLLCVSQKRSTSALQEFGLTSLQIEKNSIILYKVDVLKGECEEMYKGPEESILQASSARQYSDGDSIFFCGRHSGLRFNVVPHITKALQDWIERVAKITVDGVEGEPDVCVIGLGGTVGDIESMPFFEALSQFHDRVGAEIFCLVHVSLVPVLGIVGEQKSKPTQHSVRESAQIEARARNISHNV